ncbi:MarR family transcriptional regulator [Desertimonas flava]|uniref:MarR family transcriptional regulator n=1 Tax=Desertimonas flava TaxID=2064846 RepID=UPI0013C527FD|nr:MarR family transcriptional regulator [Desertimonas flava]
MDAVTAGLPVLHALRVKGFAGAGAVAEATGLDLAVVETRLEAAVAAGQATRRDGMVSGWRLTADGREVHAALLAEELAALDAAALGAAYEGFVALNEPFKVLCTRWQTDGQPPACIGELAVIHASALRVVAAAAEPAPRFASYEQRFVAALDRLRAGDTSAFTAPLTGSYHDVWMELHHDLLLTLDRQRDAADGD